MRFKFSLLTLFAGALAVACADAPSPAEPTARVAPYLFLKTNCPDYLPSTNAGGVDADKDVIDANCPEACEEQGGKVGVRTPVVDPFTGAMDYIEFDCANGETDKKYANNTCWDCVEGCGGINCPPGAACGTIWESELSDCRQFTCPSGYVPELTTFGVPARCRRNFWCGTSPPPLPREITRPPKEVPLVM